MTSTINGIEFDPGFAPFLLAFRGTAEYLYMDINRFKNFSQKNTKFLQYHKKILEMFNNNLGFYVGCLMWASYIKTLPQQEILSNHCYGLEYNPDENIAETRFMLNFVENFPKDMKFFIGQSFAFDENTTYDEYIYMLDNNQEYNHVVIENGKVIVTESNCYSGRCKRTIIDLKVEGFSLLNPNLTTIECKPHGLKITLEEVK